MPKTTLPEPCPWCDGPVTYSGRGRRPVYCSPKCKRAAESEIRRQERAREFGIRECPTCSLPVTYSGKGRRPTFCGPVCSNTQKADEWRARRLHAEIREANRMIFKYVPAGRRIVEDPVLLTGSIIPPEQARLEARSAAHDTAEDNDGGTAPVLRGRIPGTVPAQWAERTFSHRLEAPATVPAEEVEAAREWLEQNRDIFRSVSFRDMVEDADEKAAADLDDEGSAVA